jgi:surface carbohydrate biosynthesis protein
MVIIFPLEIKIREFYSKLFLTYKILRELKIKEFRIIIGSQRDIFNNIIKIKNCIWFDKNTFYKKISSNSILKNNFLFMLDEEGPVALRPNFFNQLFLSKKITSFYDKIFFWGKYDVNFRKKNFNFFGHPKYDLLKKPYNKIYQHESRLIKKKFKDFILIASSFEFDSKEDSARELNILSQHIPNKKKFFFKNEYMLNYKKRFEEYIHQVNAVKKLAKSFPNLNFIYRPHPYQDVELVKKRFGKQFNNLKIIFKNSITTWILASKIYIHSGCTTHIEAFVLKKNIINLFSHKEKDNDKFSYVGKTFYNISSLILFISKFLQKNKFKNQFNSRIFNLVENTKYKNFFYKSFIKMLNDDYKHISSTIIYRKPIKNFIFRIYVNLILIFFLLLSFIKNHFILKIRFLAMFLPEEFQYSKSYKERKFKQLTKYEVINTLKKFDSIERKKIINLINVVKISNNVFEISRSK